MFKLTMLFTLLSVLSLSTSLKLKDKDNTNCSLANQINCTNNSFELTPIGKIHKLLPKKKKSKNTKLIEFEYSIDSGSGSFDDELLNNKHLPKVKKGKKLKKEKKNKLNKENKIKNSKFYHQLAKTNSNLTKKDNKRHHTKKNDLPLILVTTFSGILFITLIIGSIYLTIKYRNSNKDLLEKRLESEILLPKRDYNEYNTI